MSYPNYTNQRKKANGLYEPLVSPLVSPLNNPVYYERKRKSAPMPEVPKSEPEPAGKPLPEPTMERKAAPARETVQPVAEENKMTVTEKLSLISCPHCGELTDRGLTYCSSCGKPLESKKLPQSPMMENRKSEKYLADDSRESIILSILSYLWILVLIPLFCPKQSQFSRFHRKQGLLLLILSTAANVFSWMFSIEEAFQGEPILVIGKIMTALLMIAILVLRVIGISRVLRGSTKELPLVGKYAIL